jgi:ABC-2 type transport system ATP-binding protein
LDEPAAGLDPRARLELRNLLKILAEQGKAILLSSHILSELEDICDGAIIIEKGHLLYAGSLADLERGGVPSSVAALPVEQPTGIPAATEAAQTPLPSGATTAAGTAIGGPPPLPRKGLTLIVHCLRDAEAIRTCLLEQPAVREVRLFGDKELQVDIEGTEENIPAVMAAVFASGHPVVGFQQKLLNLEQAFMQMTKGTVQ